MLKQKPGLRIPLPPPDDSQYGTLVAAALAVYHPHAANSAAHQGSITHFVGLGDVDSPAMLVNTLPPFQCNQASLKQLDKPHSKTHEKAAPPPSINDNDIRRAEEFCAQYLRPIFEEVDGDVEGDRAATLHLIMQHLHYLGLHNTAKTIAEESGIAYRSQPHPPTSELEQRIKLSVERCRELQDIAAQVRGGEDEIQRTLRKRLSDHNIIRVEKDEEENIWNELLDTSRPPQITFEAKEPHEVATGSLNRLVERLTHEEMAFDKKYMEAFLMTFRTFTSAGVLLTKLIQRYHVPRHWAEGSDRIVHLRFRVCNVLSHWLDGYFDTDFAGPDGRRLLGRLRRFLDAVVATDNAELARKVNELITRKLNAPRYIPPLSREAMLAGEAGPAPVFADMHEREVARQLTLIEYGIFSRIGFGELIDANWSQPKTAHLAPNVIAFSARFNDVSFWATSMVLRAVDLRERAAVLGKLMKVADHLKSMNNYNTLMALTSGLGNNAVKRLEHTWALVDQDVVATFLRLAALMNKKEEYRETQRRTKPPSIPFIGGYLTDLVFIEEANPKEIEGRGINFSKRLLTYKIIAELQQYQHYPYKYRVKPRIFNYLLALSERVSEDEIEKLAAARLAEESKLPPLAKEASTA